MAIINLVQRRKETHQRIFHSVIEFWLVAKGNIGIICLDADQYAYFYNENDQTKNSVQTLPDMEESVSVIVKKILGVITVLIIIIRTEKTVTRYAYSYNQNDQTINSVHTFMQVVRRAREKLVLPAKPAIFMITQQRPAKLYFISLTNMIKQ